MMKRTSLFAAAALLVSLSLLAACKKNNLHPEQLAPDEPAGAIQVWVAGPETKAASASTRDSQINSVQVFVFKRPGGALETDRYATTAQEIESGIKLSTLTGNKTVWAVVNAPKIYVTTETELETKVSDLKDNRVNNLVMAGCNKAVNVTPYNVDNPDATRTAVEVGVTRLGACVSLQKVIVDFGGTALEGCSFTITQLYLKNVVNSVSYAGQSPNLNDAALWYNRCRFESSDADGILFDTGLNIACNTGGSIPSEENVARTWFVYPNPTDGDSTSDTWAPRHTRLVMKATVSGRVNGSDFLRENNYYVFDLPIIEGNHVYSVQWLKITMLGKDNDDNDDKTTPGKVSMTLDINPWDGTTQLRYEL